MKLWSEPSHLIPTLELLPTVLWCLSYRWPHIVKHSTGGWQSVQSHSQEGLNDKWIFTLKWGFSTSFWLICAILPNWTIQLWNLISTLMLKMGKKREEIYRRLWWRKRRIGYTNQRGGGIWGQVGSTMVVARNKSLNLTSLLFWPNWISLCHVTLLLVFFVFLLLWDLNSIIK